MILTMISLKDYHYNMELSYGGCGHLSSPRLSVFDQLLSSEVFVVGSDQVYRPTNTLRVYDSGKIIERYRNGHKALVYHVKESEITTMHGEYILYDISGKVSLRGLFMNGNFIKGCLPNSQDRTVLMIKWPDFRFLNETDLNPNMFFCSK